MGFCRSTRKGRYSRIGRVARTIQVRRAAGGEVQARYKTELSAEDYVSSKAWWNANPPSCPFHPAGGCTLVPHGSYGRKTPAGTRVRRFLCKASGRTVSMLPDCLAAHLCGKLEEVERVVRAAEQATSRECAANTLRTDAIKLPGALRWVGRRVRGVQLFLSLIISLYPVKFGGLEPTVSAFGDALGSGPLLALLRDSAAAQLPWLPTPVGFLARHNPAKSQKFRLQHSTGLDPPAQAA